MRSSEKFGVRPASIPDYLALVGDAADGFPGVPGWGAKSAAAVLQRYPHVEDIPRSISAWDVSVRGAASLARALQGPPRRGQALPGTGDSAIDAPIPQGDPDELRWQGVDRPALESMAERLRAPRLLERLPAH